MSKLTIFHCLILIIISSSCNTPQNNIDEKLTDPAWYFASNMDELKMQLKISTDTFSINSTRDTIITAEKGTKLFIPKNILQFENGSPIESPVTITISEYYNQQDFIQGNLSTTSKNQLIETGGMVNIVAKCQDQILTVKKGEKYGLYFPKNENVKQMQTFYGETDSLNNIQWVEQKIEKAKPINNIVMYECKVILPGFHCSHEGYKLTYATGKYKDVLQYFNDNFKPSSKLSHFLCEKASIGIKFNVTNKGEIVNIEIDTTNKRIDFNEEIVGFFKTIPNIDTNDKIDNSHLNKNLFKKKYSTLIFGSKKINKKKFEAKYQPFKDVAITKIDSAELKYYVLEASRFGWINCDRFINLNTEKIDYFVETSANTELYLAFKNYNSFMKAEKANNGFVFKNIPLNEPIKLIGIQFIEQQPLIAIEHTSIDTNHFNLSQFKPFSLTTLNQALNTL
jgi:hypothetical protein